MSWVVFRNFFHADKPMPKGCSDDEQAKEVDMLDDSYRNQCEID